ncbi:septum site-determining protein MinC [Melghirimyces profundicolus]|uniref:Probable septum site-determining protein MinC n=1 Tax=Melghirimyces profundicolus TaxID=1242148 RepID=A0A2T6BTI2_9BACL|nr:septum site-determining protein MinC [Melghirimyces profundicolus]PTX59395.1 septum site-determining protein MinC [Melghirimyces profundicolus]
MGKVLRPGVTIKGTKDGLLFLLDESRPFSAILSELKYKLENASNLWDGPDTRVWIKLGNRQITREEEKEMRELFSARKNLIIHSIEAANGKPYLVDNRGIQMLAGTVRSGQVLEHRGDLLLLGDVNPGGNVRSTGSIFVLGALRGLAHAGGEGDESAIIAASSLHPTQLRIAEVVSRPPDEWDESETSGMNFAYLVNGQIAVDKMHQISRIRPDIHEWKDHRFKA